MHRTLNRAALVASAALITVAVATTTAHANPVTINLRIEGKTRTHFEGPVTTDVRAIDGHDGTGAHTCNGNGEPGTPGPTVGGAMADASDRGGFSFVASYFGGANDLFLDQVNEERPDFSVDGTFWNYFLDSQFSSLGMCHTIIRGGEEALFAVATGSEVPLRLTGRPTIHVGESSVVRVTNAQTGDPVAGASVGGHVTGGDGQTAITPTAPGTYPLKAERSGFIRSNRLDLCAHDGDESKCAPCPHDGDDGNCGTPDRKAPSTRIKKPRSGQRFKAGQGPRELEGTVARDPSGLRNLELRLVRKRNGKCFYFSGRIERFRRGKCGRTPFFAIGTSGLTQLSGSRDWSYFLPRRLRTGTYRLESVATDGAGNRTAIEHGRSRVRFKVKGKR